MTITKMMMTSTPMMTPIIPRFMDVGVYEGYEKLDALLAES